MGIPTETRGRSFFGRRLAPDHPRGLHLTVAALLAAVGIGGCAALAAQVWAGTGLDERLAAAFHAHARSHPDMAAVAAVVTALGSVWAIGVLAVVTAVLLARWRRYGLLACWLVSLAGGGLLREALKRAFDRPRPSFPDPVAVETSASFPSGHALGSVVCFGALAYFALLRARGRGARVVALGSAAALIAAVGWSRLYLGVHYPSDVLAGYAVGMGWVAVCVGVCETIRRARPTYAGVRSTDTGERR